MEEALEQLINTLKTVDNNQLNLDLEETVEVAMPSTASTSHNFTNNPIMWPTMATSGTSLSCPTTITSDSSNLYPYTYISTNGTGGVIGSLSTDYINGINGGKGLYVKGDAEFDGDVKIKGKCLTDTLDKIEQRLAILRPNAELEERWEKLKELGDAYRALEKDIIEKEKIWDTLKK